MQNWERINTMVRADSLSQFHGCIWDNIRKFPTHLICLNSSSESISVKHATAEHFKTFLYKTQRPLTIFNIALV